MTTVEQRLTVAISDTEPIAAEGLRVLLKDTGIYELLPPVRTLEALWQNVVRLEPRVAIIDKMLGSSDVLAWLQRNAKSVNTAMVVWGPSFTDPEALRFMQAGARGVLRKTSRLDSIMACLDAISNGATWMDEDLMSNAHGFTGFGASELTAREQQVLELVEQGLRNKDIARELGIQPGTVKIHLKHIFEKSGVRGRYGLALSGLRQRYAPVPRRLTA